jgi:hypothetical protein
MATLEVIDGGGSDTPGFASGEEVLRQVVALHPAGC